MLNFPGVLIENKAALRIYELQLCREEYATTTLSGKWHFSHLLQNPSGQTTQCHSLYYVNSIQFMQFARVIVFCMSIHYFHLNTNFVYGFGVVCEDEYNTIVHKIQGLFTKSGGWCYQVAQQRPRLQRRQLLTV